MSKKTDEAQEEGPHVTRPTTARKPNAGASTACPTASSRRRRPRGPSTSSTSSTASRSPTRTAGSRTAPTRAVAAWATPRTRAPGPCSTPSRPGDRWHARLAELLRAGQSGAPRIGGDRLFSLDRWGDHDQAVLVVAPRRSTTPIGATVAARPARRCRRRHRGHRLVPPVARRPAVVAYGTSAGGDERSTLRVVDVATGAQLRRRDPRHPGVLGGVVARRLRLRLHPLSRPATSTTGTSAATCSAPTRPTTRCVLGPDDLPDPTAWPDVELSPRRPLAARARVAGLEPHRRPPARPRRPATGRTVIEGVEAVTRSPSTRPTTGSSASPRSTPTAAGWSPSTLRRPDTRTWTTLVPEDATRRVIEWALPLAGGDRLVRSTAGASPSCGTSATHRGDGAHAGDRAARRRRRRLVGLDADHDDDLAVFAYTSFTRPARAAPLDAGRRRASPWAPLPGRARRSPAYAVEQVTLPADDGTEIPMFLVDGARRRPSRDARTSSPATAASPSPRRRRTRRSSRRGARPAGASPSPASGAAPRRARPGTGPACASTSSGVRRLRRGRRLAGRRRPHPPRTGSALRGGSQRRPARGRGHHPAARPRRAVHCAVPLLDMVRFHRFLIARLWIPEYGDPDVAEELRLAARLLALPPRRRRHLLPGDAARPRPRRTAASTRSTPASSRPGCRRRRRAATSTPCCCGSRPGPATASGQAASASRPTKPPTCWRSSTPTSPTTSTFGWLRPARGREIRATNDPRLRLTFPPVRRARGGPPGPPRTASPVVARQAD